tara:strand:+ start:438 stop:626 length:189 start_codon:yes stop_codon:yes gene_type:complete
MEKIKKTELMIPVYYYEDEHGYVIIDKEEMKNSFNQKMDELYRSTKKSQHELFTKKNYEKNR